MGGVSGAEVNERSSEDGDIARAREGGILPGREVMACGDRDCKEINTCSKIKTVHLTENLKKLLRTLHSAAPSCFVFTQIYCCCILLVETTMMDENLA